MHHYSLCIYWYSSITITTTRTHCTAYRPRLIVVLSGLETDMICYSSRLYLVPSRLNISQMPLGSLLHCLQCSAVLCIASPGLSGYVTTFVQLSPPLDDARPSDWIQDHQLGRLRVLPQSRFSYTHAHETRPDNAPLLT